MSALIYGIVITSYATEQANIMKLNSPVFQEGQEIPQKYTCEGEDISPPLSWEDIPPNTKSLALIIEDPDAPDPSAPKMTWVHWVLYNIDPSTNGLPEDAQQRGLPAGILSGLTNWNKTIYGGPCPPIGRHRYFHRLFALDTKLVGLDKPTADALRSAMKQHVITEAVLIGTYQKKK